MANPNFTPLSTIQSISTEVDRTATPSPLHFDFSSFPGSRATSPVSTPASSRPPSPILRANFARMTLSTSGAGHAPSMLSRKPSKPRSRRGSSPAMAPFLAKFEEFEGHQSGSLEKIAVIGSGSWGTALARLAAINAVERDGFDHEVKMWVRERILPDGGGKLTDHINSIHENERYLPEIELPSNLLAVASLAEVVKGATLIVFCVPHQFLAPVLKELQKPGVVDPRARAISAIKGIEVEGNDIFTYPQIIETKLKIPCSALGGANIALEVAQSQYCETTIGCASPKCASLWEAVFSRDVFVVHPTLDPTGVSLSGALKNIVALAAGFVDGMALGGNTKAAILRIGLMEMASFTLTFFPSSSPETFSHHSAGLADLITTSFGGRNRKVAQAFVETGKSFDELEVELLNGQKLQGTITSQEIHEFLVTRGQLDAFPLFETVYQICFEKLDPKELFANL